MKSPAAHTVPSSVRAAAIATRLAFAVVFVVNVQCAISFVLWPDTFVSQFELAGLAGAVAVQGLGIAFLMWNATYPAVIFSPQRFRALAIVVVVQQLIGLVGESWIWVSLPAGHAALAASIGRFIAFDAFGLVLMGATLIWLTWAERRTRLAESVTG